MSSNIRIDLLGDLGNKFRRNAAFTSLSSGRQTFGLDDSAESADRSMSCENKQDSPFRQP